MVETDITIEKEQEEQNEAHQKFLDETDWMVLRHIREKALGLETSISEGDYLELEEDRQSRAKGIIKQERTS